jgi:hypothetical protein
MLPLSESFELFLGFGFADKSIFKQGLRLVILVF